MFVQLLQAERAGGARVPAAEQGAERSFCDARIQFVLLLEDTHLCRGPRGPALNIAQVLSRSLATWIGPRRRVTHFKGRPGGSEVLFLCFFYGNSLAPQMHERDT